MRIGVFDSGIGGRSIADRLHIDFPTHDVLYVDDHEHVPYGSRERNDIWALTDAAIQPLLSANCDVIVLACNTATAAAIDALRATYPETPFVGLEPMIKPAVAASKRGTIAVCATPATLSSVRYKSLVKKYADQTTVLEPDCRDWAYLIEHNRLTTQKIHDVVNEVCHDGADVIVLACTHYHWIKDEIIEAARGRAIVIDPSEAISRRVGSILAAST